MKQLTLLRGIFAAIMLVGLVAVSIGVAPRVRADANVQDVQATSSADGQSAQISFIGAADTDYDVSVILDFSPNRYRAHTSDNGDGTGSANVTVGGFVPGGTYTFYIDPPTSPFTNKYTFTTNKPPVDPRANLRNVNVTTKDNGTSAQIGFTGTPNTDYTLAVILDQSPNLFDVSTDSAGNATVLLEALRSGETYAFTISPTGGEPTATNYGFTLYQPSGDVQNVVVTSSSVGKVRSAKISFTGAAKTIYTLVIPLEDTKIINSTQTGYNGDGTGNALVDLGRLTIGGPSYTFTIQQDEQPVSDAYTFSFSE